jgi:hypothetical protein
MYCGKGEATDGRRKTKDGKYRIQAIFDWRLSICDLRTQVRHQAASARSQNFVPKLPTVNCPLSTIGYQLPSQLRKMSGPALFSFSLVLMEIFEASSEL